MHVLFGYPGSGSAAIECALALADLPFEQRRAASWDPQSDREALARVNPLQQIPTLVLPDGSVLSESAAILIHLGLTHPDSRLLPAEVSARAQAMRGLVYIAANCYAAISISDYPERWLRDPDPGSCERLRDGTKARLHAHWDLFADTFGALLPAADAGPQQRPDALALLATVVSRWSGTRASLARQRPGFLAQLQRIERHASVRAVFERHWPAQP
ncbi:glutathione S-transferase N-terminal domain-containing protein [Roseateles sp. DB2]|uniref:glutathione S-transferase N-terminal domain-containing protein n=1 Tax=Roseateles sp. DB2 TaxID=3453717 RepID=UPI003EECFC07